MPSSFWNSCIAATVFLLTSNGIVYCDDWPQWRGLHRDGVWHESGIIESFDTEQLKHRWKAPVSSGYSGPTVAQGRVYVMDRIVRPNQQERVHCFDAETGRRLWTHAYNCEYRNISYEAGPRSSVSIESGKAYSLGSMGHLVCMDAANGSVLWNRDLNSDFQIRMPTWGIAGSPVVEDDLVIVQIGGAQNACVVAFDKTTGEERWRNVNDDTSYASPMVITQAGKRVLICWTGQNVIGIDPKTGTVFWSQPFPPHLWIIGIATPVVHNDRLFLTSCNDGSLMLQLDPAQPAATKLWQRKGDNERKTDALHSLISTPYLEGNYIYGVDAYAELRCLDARTGDRVWEDLSALPRLRYGTIHMIRNGKNIWMFTDRGELIISRLSPSGYQELSRAKLIEPTTQMRFRPQEPVCWSHPAFSNRHVFARNDKELVCVSLEK